jgi:hypothetical protein
MKQADARRVVLSRTSAVLSGTIEETRELCVSTVQINWYDEA